MELEVGMYVKYTRGAINGYVAPRIAKTTDCSDKDLIKIDNGQVILKADILKASYDILDLIQPQDLLYIDIDNGYYGRIIVPRVPETLRELEKIKKLIKNESIILKGIVTYEQLNENVYRIGE